MTVMLVPMLQFLAPSRLWLLLLAISSTIVVLVAFAFTTLPDEPGTAVALVVILIVSVAIDVVWKRLRGAGATERIEVADGNNGAGEP